MATIKGQNLRIAIVDDDVEKVIAASTECTVHVAIQVQDSSTKDSEDGWTKNEVVGINWDISVNALILSEHDDDELPGIYPEELEIGKTYDIMFAKTSSNSSQNRDFVSPYNVWFSGKAILSDLQLVAQNKNNSTYTAQFTGVGDLTTDEESEFYPDDEQEES